MKLNLGCQIHYFPGWTNVDIYADANVKPDILCDVGALPIDSDSVDFIYAGHLIEHIYPDQVEKYLEEWKRVLKVGGKLVLVTPDCGALFKDYARGSLTMEHLLQPVYGRPYSYDTPSEQHHNIFDWMSLQVLCNKIFRTAAKTIPLNFMDPPPEIKPFMGEHISTGAYQLGIIITK